MKFKAAILKKLKKDLIISDIRLSEKLKAGQVLVRIAYSGICHSQLMEICGNRGEDKYLPHLLGHEGSGEVIEIGEGVTKVKPKDKVVLSWIKGQGIEAGGVQYKKDNIAINAGAITTLNEYAVVSENRCYKLPKNIPLDIAILFGCAIPTGAGIVINEINPKQNTTIAIFGLGGVGMSALLATNIYDFNKVIVVDINKDKLDQAKELGASHFIDASKENILDEINEITNGNGVDYSVDAAGQISTIETAFSSVRKNGGLCVFASHPKTGEKISLDPHDLISGKQIRGSWGGGCNLDRDIAKFAELYEQGKLPLEKLISKEYSLDNVNDAFDDLKNKTIIRALIKIGQ